MEYLFAFAVVLSPFIIGLLIFNHFSMKKYDALPPNDYMLKKEKYSDKDAISFICGENSMYELYITGKHKKILYGATSKRNTTPAIEFNFKDLIKCEFSENGQVVGSTSTTNTLVGGLVGGAAGAIVGSTVGGKTSQFYSGDVRLFFDSFENPMISCSENLNQKGLETFIPKAKERLRRLYGTCEYIVNKNKMEQN